MRKHLKALRDSLEPVFDLLLTKKGSLVAGLGAAFALASAMALLSIVLVGRIEGAIPPESVRRADAGGWWAGCRPPPQLDDAEMHRLSWLPEDELDLEIREYFLQAYAADLANARRLPPIFLSILALDVLAMASVILPRRA